MAFTRHPDVDNWDECWACYAPLERDDTEKHHYPMPKRLGGEHYVLLCKGCHSLIDRIPLKNWPAKWAIEAVAGLKYEPKLFVMKVLSRLTEREDFPEAQS